MVVNGCDCHRRHSNVHRHGMCAQKIVALVVPYNPYIPADVDDYRGLLNALPTACIPFRICCNAPQADCSALSSPR